MLATTKAARAYQNNLRIQLPRMHPAQKAIKAGLDRYNVVDAGRRFGKDILGQDRTIQAALKDNAPVGWMAPSYRMLADNYRMLAHTLSPVITRKLDNVRIDTLPGGFIDFWSLEQPDRVRGRKYKLIVVNEAAMVPGLLDIWNKILRATLVDLKGCADFYSTPVGLNDFYTLWQRGGQEPGWTHFKYTSYDNPHIPHEELDEIVSSLPERVVRQEIMAEFLEDGAFFQGIDKVAVIQEPDQPDQHQGHYLMMGIDWALSEDFTVLTLACRECNRVVAWERFNQIDYSYQRMRVIDMARRWEVAGLLPERNSIGVPNIELLIQAGLPIVQGPDGNYGFNTSAATKPQLIQALASALEHDNFLVPVDYADELRSYRVELSTSGHAKFNAPEGSHDDRVISLALAWWALSNGQWLMS